uniref:maleylpyruvate isomerase N-terminal domain-containing protein n=1 Tax=Streptomyces sp. TG1A-60 TaxID=3129111 RepID=UPI00403FF2ED
MNPLAPPEAHHFPTNRSARPCSGRALRAHFIRRTRPLESAEDIRALDEEGRLLVAAVRKAGTDAAVPTCPDWRARDLVRHTGVVHRWLTAFVAGATPHPGASAASPTRTATRS